MAKDTYVILIFMKIYIQYLYKYVLSLFYRLSIQFLIGKCYSDHNKFVIFMVYTNLHTYLQRKNTHCAFGFIMQHNIYHCGKPYSIWNISKTLILPINTAISGNLIIFFDNFMIFPHLYTNSSSRHSRWKSLITHCTYLYFF